MKFVGKMIGIMASGVVIFCSGIIVGAAIWTALMAWVNDERDGRIEKIFKKYRTRGN